MNIIREITSIIIFFAALYCALDLFISGFNGLSLAAGALCFVLAYGIWPSKKRGQRHNDNWVIDLLEVVIELPVEMTIWLIRTLVKLVVRLFSGKGDGFDLDI